MYNAIKRSESVDWVGVNDKETDLFESLWPLPEGISYNSYVINDEKVDVIPFSKNLEHFIESALSPAKDVEVENIDEENKKTLVKVAEDELAMAIGDVGENVRLAGELVGYEIKVQVKEPE